MTRSKPVQLVLAQNDTTVLQTKEVDIRVSKSTNTVPSGNQWGLTHFQTRGPDVVEVKSDRDPGYLFSLVRLSGAFGVELDHGVTYDDASTGLTRPWKADARFQFFTDDSEIFTTLAPYDVVGQ
ncbi:hypothetical protein [Shimia sp. MIT1388]|uniref:hypothetical protein n=1 Tax=Shimia sp. MIT1388 TaxID=3096992 RepID=UPI00399C1F4D